MNERHGEARNARRRNDEWDAGTVPPARPGQGVARRGAMRAVPDGPTDVSPVPPGPRCPGVVQCERNANYGNYMART